jgi:chromosome partitioning protein
MPFVLTIAALKGGAGKTTLATTLTAAFHDAGERVLLVDADPQGTALQWAAQAAEAGRDCPPVVAVRGAALRDDVRRVGEAFDLVVIDAPPRLGIEQRSALLAAHVVLLPVTPGGADLWALGETLAVLEEVRAVRPDLRAAIVRNRVAATAFSRAMQAALADLEVPTLKAALGQRVAFAEALTDGQGVTTYAPRSPAAKEALALAREVRALLASSSAAPPPPKRKATRKAAPRKPKGRR